MKRIIIGLLAILLLVTTVFAGTITEVFNASSIRTSFYTEDNKNHYLTVNVDSDFLTSGDKNFDTEKYNYTFIDSIQNEKEKLTKEHTETISFESTTKDLSKILPLISSTLEVVTPDGYSGDVPLDMESINVEVNEYYYKKNPITVTRDYFGLSSADISNIPKSITDSGRTLNLENIEWKTSNVIEMNGQEVANRYSATANYKTTVTNKYVKNYIVSATYSGTIEKEAEPTYTAIFLGQKLFDFKIIKIILWSLLIVGALTGIGFIIKRRRG